MAGASALGDPSAAGTSIGEPYEHERSALGDGFNARRLWSRRLGPPGGRDRLP